MEINWQVSEIYDEINKIENYQIELIEKWDEESSENNYYELKIIL